MKLKYKIILLCLAVGITWIIFGVKDGLMPVLLEVGKTIYEIFEEGRRLIEKF